MVYGIHFFSCHVLWQTPHSPRAVYIDDTSNNINAIPFLLQVPDIGKPVSPRNTPGDSSLEKGNRTR
jgi:hypothetical protein